MKPLMILIALLWGGIAMLAPAQAADFKPLHTSSPNATPGQDLPFLRSERAQSVWAAGACWSECGSYCAWGQAGCLERDAQGTCLKLTDKCDRYCQRNCRTRGGPLLPVEFFWE